MARFVILAAPSGTVMFAALAKPVKTSAPNVDIVKKSGSWYNYQDIKLGQGRENVKKFLADNMDLTNEIEEKVRKYYKLGPEYRNLEEDELDENMQDSNDVTGE